MAYHTPVNKDEARTLIACIAGIEPEELEHFMIIAVDKYGVHVMHTMCERHAYELMSVAATIIEQDSYRA